MKNKKTLRILIISIAIIMSMFILTACGNDKTDGDKDGNTGGDNSAGLSIDHGQVGSLSKSDDGDNQDGEQDNSGDGNSSDNGSPKIVVGDDGSITVTGGDNGGNGGDIGSSGSDGENDGAGEMISGGKGEGAPQDTEGLDKLSSGEKVQTP